MLNRRINDKAIVVAVQGLGHVGYPMASLFAKTGFQTIGYDINLNRLNDIKNSIVISELNAILPLDKLERQKALSEIKANLRISNKEEILKNADVFIVDVPTPLNENETPNLTFLVNTCRTIAKFLKNETLVIIESTIFPGATEEAGGLVRLGPYLFHHG